MVIPLTINVGSPTARDYAATVRFIRRREFLRRHNPNVDAAWWPRSSNLTAELAELLHAAHEFGFHATRVLYRFGDGWTEPAPRLAFGAQEVKVSGYHNHHRDMITLVDGISHERLQVLIVPAETPPSLARRALRTAVDHADPIQGSELLALVLDGTPTAVVTR